MSYRTPAEVLAVAGRVLALVAAPELTPPRPVRRTGVRALGSIPVATRRPRGSPATGTLPGWWPRWRPRRWPPWAPGRVAILAPERLLPDRWPRRCAPPACRWWTPATWRKGGLSEPLVLLAAEAANGLEFDSVVVVEPGLIAGETARGLRTLYVALTRPTRRLSVVYRTPPPAPLLAAD